MTSIEPGLIDANVLVYAFDTEAPQHIASRNLLEAGRAGQATLYVTSQVLCEFLRHRHQFPPRFYTRVLSVTR